MKIIRIFLFFILVVILSCKGESSYQIIEKYSNGTAKLTMRILDKNKICYTLFYENGSKEEYYCTINDIIHGETTSFYKDGTIHIKAHYRNGQLQGQFKAYYRNGQIKSITNYLNGVRNGDYFF